MLLIQIRDAAFKEGNLRMVSKIRKKPKQRRVKLENNFLSYTVDYLLLEEIFYFIFTKPAKIQKANSSIRKVLPIDKISSVELCQSKFTNSFEVKIKKIPRIFIFICSSQVDCEEWINLIQKAVNNYKIYLPLKVEAN